MRIRDFDSFDPPAIGTRFDIDDIAIEYAGEAYFDYYAPTEDDDGNFDIVWSADDAPTGYTIEDFLRIGEPWNPIPRLNAFDGIAHDGINSGMLLLMASDGEGCHLFRHYGM